MWVIPWIKFYPPLVSASLSHIKTHPPRPAPTPKRDVSKGHSFVNSYLHAVRMAGFFIEAGEGKIPIFPLKKLKTFGPACKQIPSGLLSSPQNIFWKVPTKSTIWGVGLKPCIFREQVGAVERQVCEWM